MSDLPSNSVVADLAPTVEDLLPSPLDAQEKIKTMIGGLRKKVARIREIAATERAILQDTHVQEG